LVKYEMYEGSKRTKFATPDRLDESNQNSVEEE
jgi:hypothetical protein